MIYIEIIERRRLRLSKRKEGPTHPLIAQQQQPWSSFLSLRPRGLRERVSWVVASLWDDDDVPQMDDCGSALALALHGTERKRERELNCTNIALELRLAWAGGSKFSGTFEYFRGIPPGNSSRITAVLRAEASYRTESPRFRLLFLICNGVFGEIAVGRRCWICLSSLFSRT
uniref:Uncharacterized protein n=1 Tax=Physcomitrium patens TaxID=3218 RepID=A0A2K1KUU7_PHYPA|nr:hypothetical protein PHYPA_004556 [Physcomitrium patens]